MSSHLDGFEKPAGAKATLELLACQDLGLGLGGRHI